MITKETPKIEWDNRGGASPTILLVALLALVTPLTPVVAGVIEIARFDEMLMLEWIRTSAVEETIIEFYRKLGWPF